MDLIIQLDALVKDAKKNGEAFYNKGNKQAGVRLRKNAQDIKVLTAEIRKNVSETKNATK